MLASLFMIKGRGAGSNTPNRFDSVELTPDFSDLEEVLKEEELPLPRTRFFKDSSRTILASNDSPDIGFTYSINSYRGCEHGCIYCYARPTHEYLGLSAGVDFETKIFVKTEGPKLLREKLTSKSWEPDVIIMSGVTDCYQPAERVFKLTRGCLEVLAEFRNPVVIITKNHLVTRDIDLLKTLASFHCVKVAVSVTTLRDELCAVMEPRTSRPLMRLRAVKELSDAGIPVGVNLGPIIPGLTDHEIPEIIKQATEAGAVSAGLIPVRLPFAVRPLFEEWLGNHRPEKKEKILGLIRDMRGGKLNDPRFGTRMQGEGPIAENMAQMFEVACKKHELNEKSYKLSTEHFKRPPENGQLNLFSF